MRTKFYQNWPGLVEDIYVFILFCFIRSNIQQKQHINTMTCEQDSPGSNEH